MKHLLEFLNWLLARLTHLIKQLNRGRFEYSIGLAVSKKKGGGKMLELTITNEQKVNVQLHPVTSGGNPAPVDGAPAWSVVSGDATVQPASDGMSADLVSSDNPGDTVFMVTADADLGTGVEPISDTITLHTQHANAAALGLTASDPVPK